MNSKNQKSIVVITVIMLAVVSVLVVGVGVIMTRYHSTIIKNSDEVVSKIDNSIYQPRIPDFSNQSPVPDISNWLIYTNNGNPNFLFKYPPTFTIHKEGLNTLFVYEISQKKHYEEFGYEYTNLSINLFKKQVVDDPIDLLKSKYDSDWPLNGVQPINKHISKNGLQYYEVLFLLGEMTTNLTLIDLNKDYWILIRSEFDVHNQLYKPILDSIQSL